MRCHYFEADKCRSCRLIETPYAEQLAAKAVRCGDGLHTWVASDAWLPAVASAEQGFRNKAKLVVGVEADDASERMTLGILGPGGSTVDLRECMIQAPEIAAVLPAIAEFLEASGLPPYSVPKRRGEVKFVHVTCSPDGELMLRFVVRSEIAVRVLRAQLPQLRAAVPNAVVISVNLLPEHKAVLEGEHEEVLLGSSLAMRLGTAQQLLTLHLMPQSFFQTNTAVARELYAQAAEWVEESQPRSVWDLYCGVGGFALHVASPNRSVLGVEVSEAAVRSARRSARDAGLAASFVAADATAFALGSEPRDHPEFLIVNPPRRGIGEELAAWIDESEVRRVMYSSCNPESLARDLAAMPAFTVRAARVFDMFPHTTHLEVAVLLERRAAAA